MEAERDTIDRYVAAWLSGRVGETFETRITGVQSFGFFATIVGLGGDGLVPVSSLGREYFRYDEGARALVGENTGTRYAVGDTLELKLGEANPLTGALKFEVLDATAASRSSRAARGRAEEGPQAPAGQRGRPATSGTRGEARSRPPANHPRQPRGGGKALSSPSPPATVRLPVELSSTGRSRPRSARRAR